MVRPSNAKTHLKECALTFPNRLLRAMSAYAERKAADRAAEIRLNITHSLGIFGRYWSSLWQQLVVKGHTTFPDVCRWSSQPGSVMLQLQLHMSCAFLVFQFLFVSSKRRPNVHSPFFTVCRHLVISAEENLWRLYLFMTLYAHGFCLKVK